MDNLHLDEIIERIRKGPLLDGARALTSLAHHRMANGEGRQPSKPDPAPAESDRPAAGADETRTEGAADG